MPLSIWQWVTLAEGLPPSLVTNAPESTLKANETPSAYGLSISSEGFIAAGSIPTATAVNLKQYTISGSTYDWHYGRVWRVSGNSLVFGAPRFTTSYFKQNSGAINFNDESNDFLKLLPIGGTGLILLKANGSTILPSASDPTGRFPQTDFVQECKISTATHACELDGIVYFCNTDGLFSIDIQGNVEEVSLPIRGTITPAAVTCDYKNKYVIVGSTHVYDVKYKRWLKYSSTSFYYESRRLRSVDSAPIAVKDVAFDIVWNSGTAEDTQATLEFATRVEDREWSDTYSLVATYERASQAQIHMPIAPDNGRDWKMKITTMPSTLKIKRIAVQVQGYSTESRDS